jgi:hypothetical protein
MMARLIALTQIVQIILFASNPQHHIAEINLVMEGRLVRPAHKIVEIVLHLNHIVVMKHAIMEKLAPHVQAIAVLAAAEAVEKYISIYFMNKMEISLLLLPLFLGKRT